MNKQIRKLSKSTGIRHKRRYQTIEAKAHAVDGRISGSKKKSSTTATEKAVRSLYIEGKIRSCKDEKGLTLYSVEDALYALVGTVRYSTQFKMYTRFWKIYDGSEKALRTVCAVKQKLSSNYQFKAIAQFEEKKHRSIAHRRNVGAAAGMQLLVQLMHCALS